MSRTRGLVDFRICAFCELSDDSSRLIHYSTRRYAHPRCVLDAKGAEWVRDNVRRWVRDNFAAELGPIAAGPGGADDCGRVPPATVPAQEAARVSPRGGKREGAGRKPSVGEATVVRSFRLADPEDTDELAALIAEGKAVDESSAVRHLIRESAKRRARRKR